MIWDILENKLIVAGFGPVGKSLFREHMPADVRIGIMIKSPVTGISIDPYIPGFYKTEFQIIVRHAEANAGELMAKAVMNAIVKEAPETFAATAEHGAVKVHRIGATKLPIRFPRLEGNGIEWSLNFWTSFSVS